VYDIIENIFIYPIVNMEAETADFISYFVLSGVSIETINYIVKEINQQTELGKFTLKFSIF
jgi:hypothetical protein